MKHVNPMSMQQKNVNRQQVPSYLERLTTAYIDSETLAVVSGQVWSAWGSVCLRAQHAHTPAASMHEPTKSDRCDSENLFVLFQVAVNAL